MQLSDRLAALPFDTKRKIPIPAFNIMPDGDVSFVVTNPKVTLKAGVENLCGICMEPLEYWIAFIGGPISFKNRSYLDPPMHKDCALAAVEYCPHINRKVHRRTPDEKYPEGTWSSTQLAADKPSEWVIAITRSYKIVPHQGMFIFKTGTIADSIHYHYGEDGKIKLK